MFENILFLLVPSHGLVADGIIGYWWTRTAPASILVSTSCLVVLWTFPVPVAHVPNALPFLSSIREWYIFNRVRFCALTATVSTCLSAWLLFFPSLRSGWKLCRLCSNQMSFFSPILLGSKFAFTLPFDLVVVFLLRQWMFTTLPTRIGGSLKHP